MKRRYCTSFNETRIAYSFPCRAVFDEKARLAAGGQSACLRTTSQDCSFRRAVNLLRLHMPECRDDST